MALITRSELLRHAACRAARGHAPVYDWLNTVAVTNLTQSVTAVFGGSPGQALYDFANLPGWPTTGAWS
jgi:hypothetical protein